MSLTSLPNNILQRIGMHCAQQEYQEAINLLLEIFSILDKGALLKSEDSTNYCAVPTHIYEYYNKVAMFFSEAILSDKMQITFPLYNRIIAHKNTYLAIYSVSEFKSTDPLVSKLHKDFTLTAQNNIKQDSMNLLLKILLLYGLENHLNIDLIGLIKIYPLEIAVCYMSLLASFDIRSQIAEKRKEQLLNSYEVLLTSGLTLSQFDVNISKIYMSCSYCDSSSKHSVKKFLNKLISDSLNQVVTNIKQNTRGRKTKPIMLLPLEYFTYGHAMFRSYGTVINTLNDNFILIAMAMEKHIDNVAGKIFSDVITFEDNVNGLSSLIPIINKVKPDLIYFPSIGMQDWVIVLSNLRMANLQLMSGGHPATTYSPNMDFFLLEKFSYNEHSECLFSEKLYILPEQAIPIVLPDISPEIIILSRHKNDEIIKIAIPSKSYKLNHRYLSMLSKIEQITNKAVHFYFFPCEVGLAYDYAKVTILSYFKNASVFPSTDYQSYMRTLAQCHIQACTFPFGGSNSTIDCLNLGIIPVALKEGNEIFSLHDSYLVDLLTLPSWLVVENETEYLLCLKRLIENQDERRLISEKCFSAMNNIYYKQNNHSAFNDGITYIYKNYRKLKKISGPIFHEKIFHK